MAETLLQVKDLIKEYEVNRILDGVNLEIEQGQVVVVVGPSGCGKSTLLRCINALEPIQRGQVILEGKTVGKDNLEELRQKIGMVFQSYDLFPHLSVLDNITIAPIKVQKRKKEEVQAEARELLKRVGLEDKANSYPRQLSGGQKQRVAIARALASDPKILLCDEATSALDPQTTSSILALLKDINERFNITIVIITHQMSVVREICSHVAIVKGGEVAEQGTVEEIFTHPKTAVARELLKNDVGDGEEKNRKTTSGKELIQSGEKIRIVFSENSAFEPVIANLILNFNEPVNILKADTKNVRGVAKGEMILEFAPDCTKNKEMKQYLLDRGLDLEEVNENVD